MTPLLYFNCDKTYDGSGGETPPTSFLKDLMGGQLFGPQTSYPYGGFNLVNDQRANIRGGSVRTGSSIDYVKSGIAVGNFAAINDLESFSLVFWHRSDESFKPTSPFMAGNPICPEIEFEKSGTVLEYSANINNSGEFKFAASNGSTTQTIQRSGIDVGRWNMFYCGYDQPNSRLEVSINAEPKITTSFSGAVASSGNLRINNAQFASFQWLDEIGFYSGTLDNSTLADYYSNIRGLSYSGLPDTHHMFPQSDVYTDGQDWYGDELLVQNAPSGRRWEFVNEVESISPEYSNAIYGFQALASRVIEFGHGKCYVSPSSISVFTQQWLAGNDGGYTFGSGYISDVLVYDKQHSLIASSTYQPEDTVFYHRARHVELGWPLTAQNTLRPTIINTQNIDLSEVSTSIKLNDISSAYGFTFALSSLSTLVSGIPVAETGINLIGSGGIDRNSHIDLYTTAYSSGSATRDLYIAGHLPDSSGIPLYIGGHIPSSSGVDLFIHGWDTRSSGVDLWIEGAITLSSGLDLYTCGSNTHNGSMNLFTKYLPQESSGGLNLFTFAATDPTVQRGIDLYLKTAMASSCVGNLNLWISGPESGLTYGEMPLYLENNTYNYGSVELFLKNAYESGFKSIRLFTQGEGSLDGGLPYSASMPLFLERTEGVDHGVPMFLMVNSGQDKSLNLFTQGGTYANSGLDLSMPSTYSNGSGVLKMMIRGY